MGAKRNTPEGAKLDVLGTLVEACEAKHFPLDLADPVAPLYSQHHNELLGETAVAMGAIDERVPAPWSGARAHPFIGQGKWTCETH